MRAAWRPRRTSEIGDLLEAAKLARIRRTPCARKFSTHFLWISHKIGEIICGKVTPKMLIDFRFTNFRSFRDAAELSLVAHRADKTLAGSLIDVELAGGSHLQLLAAAAIYGANAAGKTNVVAALEYLRTAVLNSHNRWAESDGTKITTHQLSTNDEATFEIDFIFEGERHRYGLTASQSAFKTEWLKTYPKGRERTLFSRSTNLVDGVYITEIEYGPSLRGHIRDHESMRRRTRPNSLFLSVATQENQPDASSVSHWFLRKLQIGSTLESHPRWETHVTSKMCADHPEVKDSILGLLKVADSSISGIEIEERDASPFISDPPENAPLEAVKYLNESARFHVALRISDEDGTFLLPIEKESRGVRKIYSLSAAIIFTLQLGGILVLDELESSIHPNLAAHILALFQSRSTNPKGGQIIFTTHDTNLLNLSHLRRDQIWFVEKIYAHSHLYPLIEFSPRKDENLAAGYLRGRYGAVPALRFDPEFLANIGRTRPGVDPA